MNRRSLLREWPQPQCEFYDAQCRVCPEVGEPWEVLPMRRTDG